MKKIIYGIPAVGGTLLATLTSSLSLPNEYPYSKHLDVYFYDTENNNENKGTIIRLWLENIEKNVKYSENTETNNFKPLINSTDQKFQILAKLAKEYVQTQHYLNLIKAFQWNRKQKGENELTIPECIKKCSCENKESCSSTCICCYSKKCEDDCCKKEQTCDLTELQKTQKAFYFHLTNGNSSKDNVYLTPVQAHIKLLNQKISELKQENSNSEEKLFVGTLVYGFLDYKYKPTNFTNTNLINTVFKENNSIQTQKYYANIPNTISYTSKNSQTNNISSFWQELQDTNKITNLINKDNSECKDCCNNECEKNINMFIK